SPCSTVAASGSSVRADLARAPYSSSGCPSTHPYLTDSRRYRRACRHVPDAPILEVDDDDLVLWAVYEDLAMAGYPVATAVNGVPARARVAQAPPGLVLLDMRMPVLDGWGFARAAKDRGLTLTVVVMSAAADAVRWAREIEAQGVLPKPFELDDLMRM